MNEQPAAPAETTAPPGDLTEQMQHLLGDAAAAKPAIASDDQVTDRIAESAAHAISDVYGSVLSTLDELQSRIEHLRGRAADANRAATDHIRSVVVLSADAIRAADTIKSALDKLDRALGA